MFVYLESHDNRFDSEAGLTNAFNYCEVCLTDNRPNGIVS
jgi:hypothetical protein